MQTPMYPLVKRLVIETQFFLGFSLLALFGLSWFSVLRTSWAEGRQETAAVREAAQKGELKKMPARKPAEKKEEGKAAEKKPENGEIKKTEDTKPADATKTEEPKTGESAKSAEPKPAEAPPQPPPPQSDAQRNQRRTLGFYRFMGGPDMDMSSGAIETMLLYFLTVGIPIMIPLFWGISRGTAAVAAEIERGTMDMVLSRPVSRTNYLLAHIFLTLLGYALMLVALLAGNLIGEQFHSVDMHPRLVALARPALNVTAMGLAMFGITLALSAWDLVRWRPTMIASILTIAQLVGYAVANQPDTPDDSWYKVPGNFSIFSTFYPIESFVKGEYLPRHVAILTGVFITGSLVAIWRFNTRDLPANS
ncbi:MAG: ABC transporter permease subunit [bacterium]